MSIRPALFVAHPLDIAVLALVAGVATVLILAAPAPAPKLVVVCDANAEYAGVEVEVDGQYGTAREATCYLDTFDGPAVTVVFVD